MLNRDHARRLAESLVGRGIAAGAAAADALYSGGRSSSVEVRLGDLEHAGRSEGEQIGLRLFDGHRSAMVASSDFSDEGLQLLVERCLAMAREAPEDPYAGLAPDDLLQRAEPPFLDSEDPSDPDPAMLRARALRAEGAALAVSGVTNSSGGSASASRTTIALATSVGFSGAYCVTGHGCSAAVIAGDGPSMQRDHAWHSARHISDLEPAEAIGRRAGERAVARLNPIRPKPAAIRCCSTRACRHPCSAISAPHLGIGDCPQDELPSGQARRTHLCIGRVGCRRSAPAARPAVAAV
jgi:Predicted Zn-dependent proteases and their inactivated homologs